MSGIDVGCRSKTAIERHDRMLNRLRVGRNALYEWLIISSLISVLIMVYRLDQSSRSAANSMKEISESIKAQNAINADMHYTNQRLLMAIEGEPRFSKERGR